MSLKFENKIKLGGNRIEENREANILSDKGATKEDTFRVSIVVNNFFIVLQCLNQSAYQSSVESERLCTQQSARKMTKSTEIAILFLMALLLPDATLAFIQNSDGCSHLLRDVARGGSGRNNQFSK